MGLVYQPPALFPEPYLASWVNYDNLRQPATNDDNHPGETIAIETIVTLAAVERSELHAAGFVDGGRRDLPIPPITSGEARAVLIEAGWPEAWLTDILTIGACESSGGLRDEDGPLFHPGETGDGGNSLGWLQLWSGWFPAAGEDVERWWDPLVNARVGLYVRQVRGHYGGPGGWSCADRFGIR